MDWSQLAQAVKQRLFPPLKGLPAPIYAQLVVKWKQPHETLERLRCVSQKGEVSGRGVTLIRIVDPTEVRRLGLTVREYADLDGHAAVIRYEGWIGYTPTVEVHLTPVNPPPKTR
jgi:hypothetical protein